MKKKVIQWCSFFGCLLFSCISHFLFLTTSSESDWKAIYSGMRDVGFLFLILIILWIVTGDKKNVLARIKGITKRAFAAVIAGFDFLMDRFGRRSGAMDVFSYYDDQVIQVKRNNRALRKKQRKKNFNKMSLTEKVRYLYELRRSQLKKQGVACKNSDTPNELWRKTGDYSVKEDNELFPLYNEVRYRKNYMPEAKKVESLYVFKKKSR